MKTLKSLTRLTVETIGLVLIGSLIMGGHSKFGYPRHR